MVKAVIKGQGIKKCRKHKVKDLLNELNIPSETAIVAKDGEILTHDIRLKDGDTVEIIPVVSGG
ncbi:MAG: MoaD/ThiS family protein [Deferribacterota bacterium]|nr:MoaD/ThiS family protein [Deferribacterota bacterium]